jgi:hypothetical protein
MFAALLDRYDAGEIALASVVMRLRTEPRLREMALELVELGPLAARGAQLSARVARENDAGGLSRPVLEAFHELQLAVAALLERMAAAANDREAHSIDVAEYFARAAYTHRNARSHRQSTRAESER